MITVHHLNNSRSQRVLWLLEELGLAYEVVRYQRRPDMLAPPELKKVHPLGKSPVITEDGRTIAETGAIIDYILERHGQGRLVPPAGSDEKIGRDTSELQSLMRISYAVFCLKKKKHTKDTKYNIQ